MMSSLCQNSKLIIDLNIKLYIKLNIKLHCDFITMEKIQRRAGASRVRGSATKMPPREKLSGS